MKILQSLRKTETTTRNNFNSLAQFAKHNAQLKQLSHTVADGDCVFDSLLQGLQLHRDNRFTSYRQLREQCSQWAIQNPHFSVGNDLMLILHLSHHLQHNGMLSELEYLTSVAECRNLQNAMQNHQFLSP